MCPRPVSSISFAFSPVTSSPAIVIVPAFDFRSPAIASISSVCPFPSTPAIPTISPPRTSNETPRTFSISRSSSTRRSATSSSGFVGCGGPLSTRSSTSRPTIRRARLSSVAPAAGSVSIFLPRRSTVIREAISVTSFSLWLMKMIDLPCSIRLPTIPNSSCASWGVSTAVGSSRTRMSAPR